MMFLELEDLYGNIEIILFPDVYEKYYESLYFETAYLITGRVSIRENEIPKIICEKIKKLSDITINDQT